jgi:hypothetical protein
MAAILWSRLSDLRLSDIPFHPTCRVGPNTLTYVEQLVTTATHAVLFRRWRDLVAQKRSDQKQIPTVSFFKKETPSFRNLHYVKYYLCP